MGTYHFRRSLTSGERARLLGVAVGAAVTVGAAAFYLGRILVQRTPLHQPDRAGEPPVERS